MSDISKKVKDALEDFLTTDAVVEADEVELPAASVDEDLGVDRHDPPPGWAPPEPPTSADEEEVLAEAFGEPQNGIYAPHIEGVGR